MAVHYNNVCVHGHQNTCSCTEIKRSLFGWGPRYCKGFPYSYKSCPYFEIPKRPPPPKGMVNWSVSVIHKIEESPTEDLLTDDDKILRAVGKRLQEERNV